MAAGRNCEQNGATASAVLTGFAPHFQNTEFIGKHTCHCLVGRCLVGVIPFFHVFKGKVALAARRGGERLFATIHKPLYVCGFIRWCFGHGCPPFPPAP